MRQCDCEHSQHEYSLVKAHPLQRASFKMQAASKNGIIHKVKKEIVFDHVYLWQPSYPVSKRKTVFYETTYKQRNICCGRPFTSSQCKQHKYFCNHKRHLSQSFAKPR